MTMKKTYLVHFDWETKGDVYCSCAETMASQHAQHAQHAQACERRKEIKLLAGLLGVSGSGRNQSCTRTNRAEIDPYFKRDCQL